MRVNEPPEERRKNELFQCYRRGWKHGVNATADDPRFVNHDRHDIRDSYSRGLQAGKDARYEALGKEAQRLGYNPMMSVLRSDPEREALPRQSKEPNG